MTEYNDYLEDLEDELVDLSMGEDVYEEEDKIKERNKLYDHLGYLYRATIESFVDNNLYIYQPSIFTKLSCQQFIQWVIDNNPNIAYLMDD
jgi:hypothetical protein